MASQEMQLYMDFFRRRKAAKGGSLDEARRGMRHRLSQAPLPRGTVVRPISLGGVPGEEIIVPGAVREEVLFFIHGGGFVNGSAANGYFFGSQAAMVSHQRIVCPEYRLGPEFHFRDGLADCAAAYLSLLEEGISPDRIALAGCSAGGFMAIALTIWLREHKKPLPFALALLSPFPGFGLEPPTLRQIERDSMLTYDPEEPLRNLYFEGENLHDPQVNVILDDFHDFPPAYIEVCTDEILFGGSVRIAKQLGEAGVACYLHISSGLCHGFEISMTPEAAAVAREIGEFLCRVRAPLPQDTGVSPELIQRIFR